MDTEATEAVTSEKYRGIQRHTEIERHAAARGALEG